MHNECFFENHYFLSCRDIKYYFKAISQNINKCIDQTPDCCTTSICFQYSKIEDAIEISDMASWLGDEHCAIRVGYGRRTATAATGDFYFNHCCKPTICSVDTSFGGDSNQLH